MGTNGAEGLSKHQETGIVVERSGGGEKPVDLLLEAFRQGTPGSFDAIVTAHQDRVYAFCARMLSDREDALDAAQEVFLSAYRNLDRFRGEAALSTWLLRIAANQCLNRIRRRSSLARKETRFPESEDSRDTPFQPPGREEDRPDRIAESRETGKILVEALGRLEEDTRLLVLLSDVEGFSYDEISETVGIPLGTVKSKLHRARMALRKMLAPVV